MRCGCEGCEGSSVMSSVMSSGLSMATLPLTRFGDSHVGTCAAVAHDQHSGLGGSAKELSLCGGDERSPPTSRTADPNFDPEDDLSWLDDPERSVWRPRKAGPHACDARDYFDHAGCLEAAFQSDWSRTSGGAVLSGRSEGRAFGSKHLSPDILLALRGILSHSYSLLVRIFGYYCVVGAESSGVLHAMSYTGFGAFIEDSGLVLEPGRGRDEADGLAGRPRARHAKPRDEDGWDLLWISVNASPSSKEQQRWNSQTMLTRAEFLEILVRCAIDEKRAEEMVSCVAELFDDLPACLAAHPNVASIVHDASTFRRTYCYREETCAVLMHHMKTLRAVFKVYAEAGGSNEVRLRADVRGDAMLMGVDEWMGLLRDLGLLKELGVRRAHLMFATSRMLVIHEDGTSEGTKEEKRVAARAAQQRTQLPFEGFLEAVVRLALVKALPTDREMRKLGFQYPGELFGAKLDQGAMSYNAWIASLQQKQRRGLGDPIWRRVDLLVLLIVSIMQFGVERMEGGAALLLRGSPDEMLSLDEVKAYTRNPTPHVFETGGSSKPDAMRGEA